MTISAVPAEPPEETPGDSPGERDPGAPSPARPASPGAVLRILLPIVVLLALTGAVYPATQPPAALTGAVAAYLPDVARTDTLRYLPGDEVWQAQQHLVGAGEGFGDLAEPTQFALGYGGRPNAPELAGSWLQVSLVRTGADREIRTLNFAVSGDQITLQAIEYPASWQVFSPGLPVLNATLLTGRTASWTGSDVLAVKGEAGDAARAGAEITTRASSIGPGCLDTTIREQLGGDTGERVVSWCAGDQPGWAGMTVGGAGVVRRAGLAGRSAAGFVSPAGLRPGTLTGRTREPVFYQIVDQTPSEKQTAPSPRRLGLTSAADPGSEGDAGPIENLVIADDRGRVTAWRELDNEHDPTQSVQELVWQAVPGGYITGLATLGSLTVVGTARDQVTGYAADGWQLWQVDIGDVPTAVEPAGRGVLVLEASGELRRLDAATGRQEWQQTFSAGATLSVGETVLVVRDGDQVSALSTTTGEHLWTRQAPGDTVVATDTTVAFGDSRALTGLDPSDGGWRWDVSSPGLGGQTAAGSDHLVRTSAAGTVCYAASDGRLRWRTEAARKIVSAGAFTVLLYADRLELWDADGRRQAWNYPAGYATPSDLQITSSGILAYQGGRQSRWWEYR